MIAMEMAITYTVRPPRDILSVVSCLAERFESFFRSAKTIFPGSPFTTCIDGDGGREMAMEIERWRWGREMGMAVGVEGWGWRWR